MAARRRAGSFSSVGDQITAIESFRVAISQAALNVERRRGMPFSISTLLIRNLRDVFGENDPACRRAAIDEIWTEEGVFYDPKSGVHRGRDEIDRVAGAIKATDRKSTRLNSSHSQISYAVFCLKK